MFSKMDVECPECGEKTGVVMHTDTFPCSCGDTVLVEYLGCICGFSWRTSNGIFVDGMKIDVDELTSIMEESEDFIEGLKNIEGLTLKMDPFHTPDKFKSMADMIHKCIKCGEVAIDKGKKYECSDPSCGFSWEMDEFDGE